MDCCSQHQTESEYKNNIQDLTIGSPAWFCVVLVRAYRYFISPLLPPTCRFMPTCSQYAVEAFIRYGAIRGVYLTLFRILRCHPFSRGGYDPVK